MNILRKLTFAVYAIFLLIFSARHFIEKAIDHDKALTFPSSQLSQQADDTRKIRRSLLFSLILVFISAGAGYLIGFFLHKVIGVVSPITISILQVFAATILLWATLSFLGWEIQSWKGQNLTEKVNRWIFRGMYCLATIILVVSLSWPISGKEQPLNPRSHYIPIIKDIVDIAQALVIIIVTIFTAWWTYRTFAHKEKIQELKELKRAVEEYHHAIELFCGQLRETGEPDEKEIQEKLHLASLHNRLFALASLNLYTKKQFRDRIQSIVGSWVTVRRVERMQRRKNWEKTEQERISLWQQFEQEYQEVKTLIDGEANRLL